MTATHFNKQDGSSYHGEDKENGAVALKALGHVPLKLGPGLGGELGDRSLHLPTESRDLGQPLPRILLHLKVLAGLDTKVQSQPVADEDIQDPL